MSLGVYLMVDGECVYSANITHNLNKMAEEAGCYEVLWRPDELGKHKAWEIVQTLITGLNELLLNPYTYKKFNPENGRRTYEGLVKFIVNYIIACRENPEAVIEVSR